MSMVLDEVPFGESKASQVTAESRWKYGPQVEAVKIELRSCFCHRAEPTPESGPERSDY